MSVPFSHLIFLHISLPTVCNFPLLHLSPLSTISAHYQSPCASLPLSVSGLSGEQTAGREEADVSLGQFVLTREDAQVGERCQTTRGERGGGHRASGWIEFCEDGKGEDEKR